MQVQVTDPIREATPGSVTEFDKYWRELGSYIKLLFQTGDPDLTWVNLAVTLEGDAISKPVLTRTIAPHKET